MKHTLLLGYDIGSSSIKASLLDADTGEVVGSGLSPEEEMSIESPQTGWAEQHPDIWWKHVVLATRKMISRSDVDTADVAAIGISYQMHGLVMVDAAREVIHPAIIWCDSRAVEIGNAAFAGLGAEYCLHHCLNSPGNFTASKLKWVKDQRPDLYARINKVMLPGDYIAMRLTDEVRTTITGLSEGILWDFLKEGIAGDVINYFGFDSRLLAELVPPFGVQGTVTSKAASDLGLRPGIPVSYRAGDQPNNALSLNVLAPGEFAATAGTSGVIYGVTMKNVSDPAGRVNTFAHVNYSEKLPTKGVLLCINGTGIQYSWLKQRILNHAYTYEELNALASRVGIGSEGLLCYPYGNGAERSLGNHDVHAHFAGINFNMHGKEHLIRAAQEGIAFSFRYGLDVMKGLGLELGVIRAGYSNLFQSEVFRDAFVNTCGVDLEMFNTDGAQGAARGAGIGLGYYSTPEEAFVGLKLIRKLQPNTGASEKYNAAYEQWLSGLRNILPS